MDLSENLSWTIATEYLIKIKFEFKNVWKIVHLRYELPK